LRKTVLTEDSLRQVSEHIAGQSHAMAGATIAASGALACGLGEACVRISRSRLEAAEEQAAAQRVAGRLSEIRGRLEALVDEDGAAITGFETLRDAGAVRQAQDRLCRMPLEMGGLAAEAADLLQEFRPLVRGVQDDLEMAITLLVGAARAASLLLDSNLRLWPEPMLLAEFEPALAGLRTQAAALRPVERVRS
jgi:formiminotetrahydrofolate cyclodeaminase